MPLVQLRKAGAEKYTDPVLRHKQEVLLQKSEIDGVLNQAFPRIQETLEKWTQRASGWKVDRVETLWLDFVRYLPLWGDYYIPLPADIRHKTAVLNVKNKDGECLRWTPRSARFPARDHVDRPTKHPTQDGLTFEGINAPILISQIPKVGKAQHFRSMFLGRRKL